MADKFVRIKTSTNNYVWVKEGSVTPEELDVVKNNLINEIKVVSESLKDYAKIEDLNDVAEQSKEYTDNQIKTIRENHFIVIDELPTPSKDYVGNIYLVANPDDTYGEYIVIDDNGEYKWEAIGTTQISDDFRVDDALSDTSINPVQNKVIKEALDKTVTTDTDQTITAEKTFTDYVGFMYYAGDINIYGETNENGYEEPVIYFNGPFGSTKYKRNTIINWKSGGGDDTQTFTFPDESGTLATEEKLEDALSGYVPEFPNMSQYNKSYLVSYNANTKKSMPITMGNAGDGSKKADPWAVLRTGENGVFTVGNPTGDYHATPKVYVDKGLWLPAYDETVTYAKDVMVVKDGKIYKSLIDNNIGNLGNTETEATSWEDLLSGKLNKFAGEAGFINVYAIKPNGENIKIRCDDHSCGVNNIVRYILATKGDIVPSQKGVITTNTPTLPYQVANKLYVDEQIASVKKYYIHKLYFTIDSSGESLYVDVIDSSATKYTLDAIVDGSTAIHNYKPIACSCSIRSGSAVAPATLSLESGQLSATVFNDAGTLSTNSSITFVRDDIYEI